MARPPKIPPPKIIVAPDRFALLARVRAEVEASVSPGDRIAIPTGRTPGPLYRQVREDPRARAQWASLRYLQLDEYIDAPPGTVSFAATLAEQLFDPIGVPDGERGRIDDPGDPGEAARLDRILTEGGPLRLCLLGLGDNGHIAFNEPADLFASGYHVTPLAPETIAANFPDAPTHPVHALTIGIDQILAADRVLLWVPQSRKQPLLDRLLAGQVDPRLPASALLDHPNWTVLRGPK